MRKAFSVVLSIILVFSALCLPVTALDIEQGVDDSTSDVFDIFGNDLALAFEIIDGEAVVVDCDNTVSGELEVPETYNGYPVTKIAKRAFRASTEITSVILPEGLTVIGEEAFGGCASVENIVVPSTVTTIENGAFVLCESLNEITLPETVTTIFPYTFLECTALETVTLGAYVTEIGQDAFDGCVSLKTINLPETVTTIGEYAFWGCPIEYLIISDNVQTVGERAFVEANIGTLRFYSVAQMEKFGAEITADEVICLCKDEQHLFTSIYDISCGRCSFKAEILTPAVISKGYSHVTLQAVAGYEYSINGVDFQESNTFDGLYIGNEYTFYQRVKAYRGEPASENSAPLTVSTDNFEKFTVNGKTADYVKIANSVEDKKSYKVVVKYTAVADTPVSFLTAEEDVNVNRGYVEAENYAVKTLKATNSETVAEIMFTVDKHSSGGISQGDALYAYIPNGCENAELSILSFEELTNSTGGVALGNGGASILAYVEVSEKQALRFFFNYDTETGNDVVINGKNYNLISRGFLIANGAVKADMLVSREKALTDSGIVDMNVTDFDKCWETIDNGDGTTRIVYSNYVTGFEAENGSYNNSKRLYVKGYIVLEADGEQFTLYSGETNYTVSEIANMNNKLK